MLEWAKLKLEVYDVPELSKSKSNSNPPTYKAEQFSTLLSELIFRLSLLFIASRIALVGLFIASPTISIIQTKDSLN